MITFIKKEMFKFKSNVTRSKFNRRFRFMLPFLSIRLIRCVFFQMMLRKPNRRAGTDRRTLSSPVPHPDFVGGNTINWNPSKLNLGFWYMYLSVLKWWRTFPHLRDTLIISTRIDKYTLISGYMGNDTSNYKPSEKRRLKKWRYLPHACTKQGHITYNNLTQEIIMGFDVSIRQFVK